MTIKDWSMRDVWNEATLREDREVKPRDYMWASSLSKPAIDNYLSMIGTKPTNPPNDRSRRKFLMGNIVEEIQGIVISALGLRTDQQQEVWTEGVIRVKGKLDFLVQGKPDYAGARDKVKKLGFSQEMIGYLLAVIDRFEQKLGDSEFAPMVRECKSCSSYVLEKVQSGGHIIGHQLQLYHYLKGLNLPLGYVDYISKDDSLMEQDRVCYPDTELEKRYNDTLIELKGYLDAKEQPPPAPLIEWDGKFQRSFAVEYSNYLTLIYGFLQPEDYRNAVTGKISRWNRVLARLNDINSGKRGKPSKKEPLGKLVELTDNNLEAIEEMKREGYDAYELAKTAVVIEEEGEV